MHDPATPALTRIEAALAACLPTQFRAGRWRGVDGVRVAGPVIDISDFRGEVREQWAQRPVLR